MKGQERDDNMTTRKTREPAPFNIDDPEDIKRLHEELYDYMKISVNDGTDMKGRRFALDALKALVEKERAPPERVFEDKCGCSECAPKKVEE